MFSLPDGISIELLWGAKSLLHAPGYVGKLLESPFELHIHTPPDVIGFEVDGQKHVSAKPFNRECRGDEKRRVFTRNFPILINEDWEAYTPYPVNHTRLLVPRGPGAFEMWELALHFQDGSVFLTSQMAREVRCFRKDDGDFVCPGFDEWAEFLAFLRLSMDGSFAELPSLAAQPESKPVSHLNLDGYEAEVLWYNAARGLGALRTSNGARARVHWSQIEPRSFEGCERPFRALLTGEKVGYASLQKPCLSAGEHTAFRREARKVRLLPSR